MTVLANETDISLAIQSSNEIPQLTREELRKYRFPKPPTKGQIKIAEYVDDQLQKFDSFTTEAQQAIEILEERRTALISAAVTGKIDVRGWKRPSSNARIETEMEVA